MSAEAFDFRQPPPGGLEGRVAGWLTEACDASPRLWSRVLPFPARLRFGKVESVTAAAALRRLTDDVLGLRLAVEGFPDAAPLIVLPRPLLLALVVGTLGEAVTTPPADRPLTPVEDALVEWLVQQLWLDPLQDAWPAPRQLRLTAAARGEPRKVCATPPSDVVLFASLAVEGPFGSQAIGLVLPRSGPVKLLARPEAAPDAPPTDRGRIEALVYEMPAELSVVLGTADVPLSQLARLEAGGLLILEQRVTEPLTARVAGADKYRVWPGALGRRRAVQIESTVSP